MLFPTDQPRLTWQVPWAVWISATATLIALWAGLPSSVYFGYQEIHNYGVVKSLDWSPRVDERVFLWNADWKSSTAYVEPTRRLVVPVGAAPAASTAPSDDDCPCRG